MDNDPDLTLLRRFARGDDAALGDLAARFERPMLGLALGLLADRELAKDAVQEVWMRVIRSAKHFQGQSSVKTWLYRILINRCLDMRAAAAKRRTLAAAESRTFPDDLPQSSLESDEGAARVRAAVRELPEPQQMILTLSYHEGLTHELAADVLGIPVGTLKSRLHAALRSLRERLGAEVAS